jgi:hypothetical protein
LVGLSIMQILRQIIRQNTEVIHINFSIQSIFIRALHKHNYQNIMALTFLAISVYDRTILSP